MALGISCTTPAHALTYTYLCTLLSKRRGKGNGTCTVHVHVYTCLCFQANPDTAGQSDSGGLREGKGSLFFRFISTLLDEDLRVFGKEEVRREGGREGGAAFC